MALTPLTNTCLAINPTVPSRLLPRLLWLPDRARAMGIHLMASRGAGKSRLLGRVIAWQDFVRRVPLVLMDPHGGAIDNFLDKLLWLPPSYQQQLAKRIIYVNMTGQDGFVTPFPLNFRFGQESLYAISQRYLDVLRRIDPYLATASIQGWNALWRIGTHAGMALAGLGLQITEAQDLLSSPTRFTPRLNDAASRNPELEPIATFFKEEWARWDEPTRRNLTQSFLNKTALFWLDPTMRAMFGASKPAIDWQQVLNENWAVLLDFRDEHDIERLRFKLLWVYSTLLEFIKRRGPGRHKPLSLVIDEITYLLSPENLDGSLLETDLDELVSRISRNYSVWLTLAHQELSQLTERMQHTLMTMGTQILGSTSDPATARFLARRFLRFNPALVRKEEPLYANSRWGSTVIDYRTVEYSLDEQQELNSFKFLDLPRYHFLLATAPSEGTVGSTLRQITIQRFDHGMFVHEELVARVRSLLTKLHGQKVTAVLRQIAARELTPAPITLRTATLPPPNIDIATPRTSHHKDRNDDYLSRDPERPINAELLTAAEVAESLQMRIGRVYALVREGTLPALKIGRQVRFSRQALNHFVQSGGKPLPGGWRRKAD